MTSELAIIILNYRTAALMLDCLASLAPEIEPGVRVVVVDNASGDGSAEALERGIAERGFGAWAALVRSPVNGGFAAGNNLGIRAVDAAAYVLLNSDTLVRPGALRALRDAARRHPRAGVIGAGMLDAEGRPDYSHFRAIVPLSELVRGADLGPVSRALRRFDPILPLQEEPGPAEWVSFACVLVRREALDEVGPLDDGFFMYFEDVDYCRRARAAGWTVLYWPAAKVLHFGGSSSTFADPARRRSRAPRYFYEARARYFAKHFGRSGLWLANLLWAAGRVAALPLEALGRRSSRRAGEALDLWTNAARPVRPAPGQRAPPAAAP